MPDRPFVRSRPFVPPEPPKTTKARGTRERVLRVAAELFVEQGYAGVSMRDIAEKAQLTHGGLYGHFRSKGQLLVEAIRWKIAERERSPDFLAAVDDPTRSAGLLVDRSGRDIRLLYVDAAAAARHDEDVAAGLHELLSERHAAIHEAIVDDVEDADVSAFLIAVVETGVAFAEATGALPYVERVLPALQAMLASLAVDPE